MAAVKKAERVRAGEESGEETCVYAGKRANLPAPAVRLCAVDPKASGTVLWVIRGRNGEQLGNQVLSVELNRGSGVFFFF